METYDGRGRERGGRDEAEETRRETGVPEERERTRKRNEKTESSASPIGGRFPKRTGEEENERNRSQKGDKKGEADSFLLFELLRLDSVLSASRFFFFAETTRVRRDNRSRKRCGGRPFCDLSRVVSVPTRHQFARTTM